ncbi:MAG: hypothetical protein ACREO0_13835 [Pseudoxanthomonas sp.]
MPLDDADRAYLQSQKTRGMLGCLVVFVGSLLGLLAWHATPQGEWPWAATLFIAATFVVAFLVVLGTESFLDGRIEDDLRRGEKLILEGTISRLWQHTDEGATLYRIRIRANAGPTVSEQMFELSETAYQGLQEGQTIRAAYAAASRIVLELRTPTQAYRAANELKDPA